MRARSEIIVTLDGEMATATGQPGRILETWFGMTNERVLCIEMAVDLRRIVGRELVLRKTFEALVDHGGHVGMLENEDLSFFVPAVR